MLVQRSEEKKNLSKGSKGKNRFRQRLTQQYTFRGHVMSMRGNIISEEYQNMVWVRDDKGGEYALCQRS